MMKIQTVEKKITKVKAVDEGVAGSYNEVQGYGESSVVRENSMPENSPITKQMVEKENMERAYQRVVKNKGAAGVDNMKVSDLKQYLKRNWTRIRKELLEGEYKPQEVRAVNIPKANGGQRQLGIPTVVDRLIQQALQQVLSPIYEPTFSESSYGFRAGKSPHDAIKQAKKYQTEGRQWVVDIDLAEFFDEVNHDRLISRVRKQVNEWQILRLIRSYLKAGMMKEGLYTHREKGTPQGSPLSPLLSNIVLDELDKELESRNHRFCRYADDSNIYVGSRKSGERVMNSIREYIEERLRLKVNEKKSVVGRPWKRKFLGYSFIGGNKPRIRVPKESQQKLRMKLKQLFREGRGRNIKRFIEERLAPVLRGWINYFRLAEVKQFAEEIDKWIRRRLRLIMWRQWKRPKIRYKRLISAGISEETARKTAYNGRSPWWNSGTQTMNFAIHKRYFEKLGLMSLLDKMVEFQKQLTIGTAVYGTVRTVV